MKTIRRFKKSEAPTYADFFKEEKNQRFLGCRDTKGMYDESGVEINFNTSDLWFEGGYLITEGVLSYKTDCKLEDLRIKAIKVERGGWALSYNIILFKPSDYRD